MFLYEKKRIIVFWPTDQRVPSVATRRGGARQPHPEATPSGQEVLFDADPHVRARQMRQFRFTPSASSRSPTCTWSPAAASFRRSEVEDWLSQKVESTYKYLTNIGKTDWELLT